MDTLAVASFVVAMAGWASYVPVAKVPAWRRTMWPTRALIWLSLLMASVAASALWKEGWTTSLYLIVATWVSFSLFTLVYYLVLKMPIAKGRPEIGKTLQPFSVLSESGQQISADDYAGKGPCLLVFFRGFW